MKAETGAMHQHIKEHQTLPANPQRGAGGRGRDWIFPGSPLKESALPTSGSWSSSLQTVRK